MELFKMIFNLLLFIQLFITLSWTKSMEDSKKSSILQIPKTPSSISALSSESESGIKELIRKARQSRCIRCYDDRYLDDGRGYNYGRQSYRGGSGGGGYDDRNSWYYYPERHDGYSGRGRYDRYPDQYGGGRYDDRYNSRTYDNYESRYNHYERYDPRPPVDYRVGYGYDSRDRYYEQPSRGGEGYPPRDRYYDRPRGGGGYDGRYYYDRDVYDRYPYRGGTGHYDYKNYRPWDETYRGTSGFDSSGRGYYFANTPNEQLTPSNYKPGPGQAYLPHSQSPPRPISNSPNNNYNNNNNIQTSSPPSSPSSQLQPSGPSTYYHYQHHHNRPKPDEDISKGYAGGWSYVNDRDKPSGYNDKNKDIQSSPYGPRPRPLGGSYLHDRDSNIPTKVANDNKDVKKQQQDDKFKDSGSSSSLTSLKTDGQKSNSINGANKMTN